MIEMKEESYEAKDLEFRGRIPQPKPHHFICMYDTIHMSAEKLSTTLLIIIMSEANEEADMMYGTALLVASPQELMTSN
jgi:hypothetical protein